MDSVVSRGSGPLALLLAAASFLACQTERPETPVGAPCMKNAECVGHMKRQFCALAPGKAGTPDEERRKICTRACDTRKDCPLGFECLYRPDADQRACFTCVGHEDCPSGSFCLPGEGPGGGAGSLLCQERQVEKDEFGKECKGENDPACSAARGFFCHGELPDDPLSYCTKRCADDVDCPPSFFCGSVIGEEYFPATGRKRCLKRTHCSSCRSDGECNPDNPLCVRDKRGRGYCTRPCDIDSRMPCNAATASTGHLECLEVIKDLTRPEAEQQIVAVCAPRYGRDDEHPQGRCSGAGITCDPCRPHMPSDCMRGRQCIKSDRDEWLCRKLCSSAAECENPALDITFRCTPFTSSDRACSASSEPGRITCWR